MDAFEKTAFMHYSARLQPLVIDLGRARDLEAEVVDDWQLYKPVCPMKRLTADARLGRRVKWQGKASCPG
jgi:hypothetical protein